MSPERRRQKDRGQRKKRACPRVAGDKKTGDKENREDVPGSSEGKMEGKKTNKRAAGKSHVKSTRSQTIKGQTTKERAARSQTAKDQAAKTHSFSAQTAKKEPDKKEADITESTKRAFRKPGNFLYPAPPVMVSVGGENEKPNIITIAWAGTVCSDPPMVSISVRKERYSYEILKRTKEFVINLPTNSLAYACDFCGCTSGRDVDKFREMHLTAGKSTMISAPTIEESPVSIE